MTNALRFNEDLNRQEEVNRRQLQRNRTFFFRRKCIIDEVYYRISAGIVRSETEAIEQLEAFRQTQKFTLHKLSQWIDVQAKARTKTGLG